jgi:hypothetical protein
MTAVILYTLGALVATAGFALVGVAGVGVLGTMFRVELPSAFVARLPFVGGFVTLGVNWLLGVGLLLVVAGLLEVGAGQRLWHRRRSGGILGVVSMVLSIIAGVFWLPLRPLGEIVGVTGMIVALALLSLLGLVWRRLR